MQEEACTLKTCRGYVHGVTNERLPCLVVMMTKGRLSCEGRFAEKNSYCRREWTFGKHAPPSACCKAPASAGLRGLMHMVRLIEACSRTRKASRVSSGRREGCTRGSMPPSVRSRIMWLPCMHYKLSTHAWQTPSSRMQHSQIHSYSRALHRHHHMQKLSLQGVFLSGAHTAVLLFHVMLGHGLQVTFMPHFSILGGLVPGLGSSPGPPTQRSVKPSRLGRGRTGGSTRAPRPRPFCSPQRSAPPPDWNKASC